MADTWIDLPSVPTVTPIVGTVTALQGTTPWNDNISQFGGNNVVTGTGASGLGIPRVTVSNDSNILATQSGTWTVQQGNAPWSVSQSGVWTTGRTWALSSGTDSVSVVQSGAWTATVTQGTSPWVVSGTVTANQGTSPWVTSRNWTLSSATDSIASVQSGTWTTGRTWTLSNSTDSIAAVQSGTWNIGTLTSITNPVTVNQGTSPWVISGSTTVSGTVTANQGTSPWTVSGTVSAVQSGTWTVQQGTPPWSVSQSGTWNIGTVTAVTSITNPVTVTQGTSPWVISGATTVTGTVTANQGTSPWVISGTVTASNFPTTVDTNYGTVGANTLRSAAQIGNATGAALFGAGTTTAQVLRVVLPTDQTSIPAAQSGTWTTGRTWTLSSGTDSVTISGISGTISLPTGASTSANQTNGTQKTQIVDGAGAVIGAATTIGGVNYFPVIQASSGTPGSAVPARSTVIAGSDGTNARTILTDASGNQYVRPITWSYKNIAGAATTTVKSGAGVFHVLVQNSGSGTTTIYDNTAGSGTVIATINNAGGPATIIFDVAFATGLTIVTTNGANNVTAMYL